MGGKVNFYLIDRQMVGWGENYPGVTGVTRGSPGNSGGSDGKVCPDQELCLDGLLPGQEANQS